MNAPRSPKKGRLRAALAMFACAALLPAAAQAQSKTQPNLDAGFHEMYELHFDQARADFSAYQQKHPADPFAKAALAASYLYEEFQDKHVFTAEFFLDDNKLLHGIPDKPDAALCRNFLRLNQHAREMALESLKSNPRDPNGLLALTVADGMMADYDALIAKRQLDCLHNIRKAEDDAARLLAVDPGEADAKVAIGAGNYILGSLPAYKRMLLWLGGIRGDRERGMNQLELAALHGHYLKPMAQALLALCALREHEPELARNLFLQLTREFPENPAYAQQLAFAEKSAGKR